jgi:hypothetical protein
MNIQEWDVCLAYVEFADHPGIGKVRPVIILDATSRELEVLVIKVTSHAPRDSSYEVVLQDWQAAGLLKPSTARCMPPIVLIKDRLLGDGPLGHLSKSDILALRVALGL